MSAVDMGQLIFDTFQLFTDIPYNIWPWLLLVCAPVLVFSATPQSSLRWRVGRILLAIAAGYVLVNLTLHTHRALQWKEYEMCQSQFEDGAMRMNAACEHLINIADGASTIFYMLLGWVPAAAYAGFWEFWWRRKYREAIKAMGIAYRWKWFSTLLIVCSAPVLLFTFTLFVWVVFMRTVCPEWVANTKCWFPH